jgi:glutamate transport system substrate-binding protein
VVVLIASACGSSSHREGVAHSRFYGDQSLRIAVRADLPGIGYYESGIYRWSGLDIAIAKYIMTKLGIAPSDAHLHPVQPADRDATLLQRNNDLVIASYSITDGRIQRGISFTVPYLLSYQDIMVRSADAATIKTVNDLRGKRVCTGTESSTPYQHLAALDQERDLKMRIVPRSRADECVNELVHGRTDAVVSDTAILLGYQHSYSELHLVGTRVWPRPEQWSIGFISRKQADLNELNVIMRRMFDDGSWAKAITTSFCPDLRPDEPVCRGARIFLDNAPPKT